MAESTIITGQFVRISQTPASIGERLLALVIDYFLIVIYVYSTATLLTELRLPSGFTLIFFLCVIYLPILGYSFLCETFNHGQSFGKRIMNIRVVKADGTTPSISSYLLRWLLFPIDGPITGGLGILVVRLHAYADTMYQSAKSLYCLQKCQFFLIRNIPVICALLISRPSLS